MDFLHVNDWHQVLAAFAGHNLVALGTWGSHCLDAFLVFRRKQHWRLHPEKRRHLTREQPARVA